jgi:hypothetical protein
MWLHTILNVTNAKTMDTAHDCRSMMDTSMNENIDIIYKKVWRRNQEQKEQVN